MQLHVCLCPILRCLRSAKQILRLSADAVGLTLSFSMFRVLNGKQIFVHVLFPRPGQRGFQQRQLCKSFRPFHREVSSIASPHPFQTPNHFIILISFDTDTHTHHRRIFVCTLHQYVMQVCSMLQIVFLAWNFCLLDPPLELLSFSSTTSSYIREQSWTETIGMEISLSTELGWS